MLLTPKWSWGNPLPTLLYLTYGDVVLAKSRHLHESLYKLSSIFLIFVTAFVIIAFNLCASGEEHWKERFRWRKCGVTVPNKGMFWWLALGPSSWLWQVWGDKLEAVSSEPWLAVWFFWPPFSSPLVLSQEHRDCGGRVRSCGEGGFLLPIGDRKTFGKMPGAEFETQITEPMGREIWSP